MVNCDVGHISRPLGYPWDKWCLGALCPWRACDVACKDSRGRLCLAYCARVLSRWRARAGTVLVGARVLRALVGRVVYLRAAGCLCCVVCSCVALLLALVWERGVSMRKWALDVFIARWAVVVVWRVSVVR